MDHRASLLNAMPHLRHDKPTTNAPSQLHSPYGPPITDHCVGRAPAIPASHRKKFRLIVPLDAEVFEQANR